MPLENLWFRHDFNARGNPKLLKLKMEMKMEGVGIYWCLIEMMYELGGYIKEEDLELFCFNEHIEIEKVNKVLSLAKFKFDQEKGYYSNGVLERIEKRESYCLKQKEKAEQRWNKAKEKKATEENQNQLVEDFNKVYDKIKNNNFDKKKKDALESLENLKESK